MASMTIESYRLEGPDEPCISWPSEIPVHSSGVIDLLVAAARNGEGQGKDQGK